MINIIGVFLNTVPVILLSYWRGLLSYRSGIGTTPEDVYRETVKEVDWMYHVVLAFQLISAFILADALRRIRSSLKRNPYLVANEKTMWLHITNLMVYNIVFSVAAYFVFRAFSETANFTD